MVLERFSCNPSVAFPGKRLTHMGNTCSRRKSSGPDPRVLGFRLKLKDLAENFGEFYVFNDPGLVLGPETGSRQGTRSLVLHSDIEITFLL